MTDDAEWVVPGFSARGPGGTTAFTMVVRFEGDLAAPSASTSTRLPFLAQLGLIPHPAA